MLKMEFRMLDGVDSNRYIALLIQSLNTVAILTLSRHICIREYLECVPAVVRATVHPCVLLLRILKLLFYTFWHLRLPSVGSQNQGQGHDVIHPDFARECVYKQMKK